MITINGFLHRSRLRNLVRRWMFGALEPGDADELLRLVHFNNVYVSRYLGQFADTLFTALHGSGLQTRKVANKGELRDRICVNMPQHCSRCSELAGAYARNPGQYFRETPFHGKLYFANTAQHARYAGSSRIKRLRRLAEKSARRIVDWLHETAGMPAAETPEQLQQTEQQLLIQLQQVQDMPLPERLAINDVAGIKLVLEQDRAGQLPDLLQAQDCTLVEQEHHDGVYRATNLVVAFPPDREDILSAPLHDRMLQVFAAHGYSADQATAAFREFVSTDENRIHVEIIVTSYREMLESEIGRCIHEERIIRQRHNPRYYGQLAQNIGFLMEYLFTYPALPYRRIGQLPLRIQDRYLPDYFDEVWRRLYNNPSVELNEL